MSMEIDPQKIAKGRLTYLEAKYLHDRMLLPAGYKMPDNPKEGEGEEPPSSTSRVPSLEEQQTPTIEAKGGIQPDEDEEDYVEGWNNDQRRGALSERGLSVEGNKDEMIARLRRSDMDELVDGDLFEA